jgi:transposase
MLGERGEEQKEMWLATWDMPKSPGHPFYKKLNQVLAEADFNRRIAEMCAPYYAEKGRPSIPPDMYFRMLLIGYFEGITSQRGIVWRCSDSLSLKEFLGLGIAEQIPDHSSLTRIRQRLPLSLHEQVYLMFLQMAQEKGLLSGRTLLVDSTTLEANAAMRTIVRKTTGENWREFLLGLAKEDGIANPKNEELRRFDRGRKDKKVSNKDWKSGSDPDSRIMKMKDGRTHLGYKAEHAVDADSGLVVSAAVHTGDVSDPESLAGTLIEAQASLVLAGSETEVTEVVADKGYHKLETLGVMSDYGVRTYIPERKSRHQHCWGNKAEGMEQVYRNNQRRVSGKRGRKLSKKRSELPERSFAHVCETGGGRRTWIRGITEVNKSYLMRVAGYNLGVILRRLFGVGTPRSLQGASRKVLQSVISFFLAMWEAMAHGVFQVCEGTHGVSYHIPSRIIGQHTPHHTTRLHSLA